MTGVSPEHPVPWWFEAAMRWGLAAVMAVAIAGVPLAVVGWFRPLPVALGSAVILFALLVLWPAPRRRDHRTTRGTHAAAAVAVLIAVVATAWNAGHSAQHVMVDRDPAVYNVTGLWLADHGDLTPSGLEGGFLVDTERDQAMNRRRTSVDLRTRPGIAAAGSGFYQGARPDTDMDTQFFHLLPVLVAAGEWIGGLSLAFRVGALTGGLALLAVWMLAARLLRPWFATAAVAAAAVTMPFTWFARDTYTEPLTLALVFAALAVLHAAEQSSSVRLATTAGLLMGTAAMARIDVVFLFAPLAAVLVVRLIGAARSREPAEVRGAAQRLVAVAAGAAVPTAIAWLDAYTVASEYLSDLAPEVALIWAAVVVIGGGGLAVARLERAGRFERTAAVLHDRRRLLAGLAAAVVAGLGIYGWLVRPHVAETVDARTHPRDYGLVAVLQEREGEPVDSWRTYNEDSLARVASYTGPVAFGAALVGASALAGRVVAGRDRRWLPFLAVFGASTALYGWKMSITPDQLWSLRRFLPVTLPGVAVLTAWAAQQLWDLRRLAPRWGRAAAIGGSAASVALVVVAVGRPAQVTEPVVDVRDQFPVAERVEEMCRRLGPPDETAVLFWVDTGRHEPPAPLEPLIQTVQVLCDVPVAAAPSYYTVPRIEEMAERWEDQGRELVVVARQPDPFGPDGPTFEPVLGFTYHPLEQRLTRRPDNPVDVRVDRYAWRPGESG